MLCHFESIDDIGAEISGRALDFGMSKEQFDGAQAFPGSTVREARRVSLGSTPISLYIKGVPVCAPGQGHGPNGGSRSVVIIERYAGYAYAVPTLY